MINNVSQISPAYTQTSIKRDNVDTLPAAEWNAISAAVALAHTKINDILSEGQNTISGNKIIIESQEGDDDADITLSAENEIYINADQTIELKANTISIGDSDSSQATLVYGDFTVVPAEGNTITAGDLYTMIAYFKNEGTTNGTGPFASLHSNSQS